MNIKDIYDRCLTLPEADGLHSAAPMALAEAFKILRDNEREKTDDELALLYDLARSMAAWDFCGTRADALAYLANNDDPTPAPGPDPIVDVDI